MCSLCEANDWVEPPCHECGQAVCLDAGDEPNEDGVRYGYELDNGDMTCGQCADDA